MADEVNVSDRGRRFAAVIGTAVFLLLAPGTVAGYIPWRISRWQVHAAFHGFLAQQSAAIVLLAAGIAGLLETFGRFAFQGIGTPAPVFPTRHLVVRGSYRYVRNPMYLSVLALIAGQALLFGDVRVAEYGALAWLVVHLFVLGYEEPTLRRTFGDEYALYCAHVSRWLPRLNPWPS